MKRDLFTDCKKVQSNAVEHVKYNGKITKLIFFSVIRGSSVICIVKIFENKVYLSVSLI